MEFKLKYLVSYATLMRNYFMHMNFTDIKTELESKDEPRARHLLMIAAMVVAPQALDYPTKVELINDEILKESAEFLLTEAFHNKFHEICQMDNIPEISLAQMKVIKGEMIDKIVDP